jgi:CO/xanthine dehydrogenase Mo-binding subunit
MAAFGPALATNVPPHGVSGLARRRVFLARAASDQVAKVVGLPEREFRRRNFIKGETTATSRTIAKVDPDGLLTQALELTDYHAKREARARKY